MMPIMASVLKMCLALASALSLCVIGLASMVLNAPDVSLVRKLGCFDTLDGMESTLLSIQSNPWAAVTYASAVLAVGLLFAAAELWPRMVARPARSA